jgi:hypothetical protein
VYVGSYEGQNESFVRREKNFSFNGIKKIKTYEFQFLTFHFEEKQKSFIIHIRMSPHAASLKKYFQYNLMKCEN